MPLSCCVRYVEEAKLSDPLMMGNELSVRMVTCINRDARHWCKEHYRYIFHWAIPLGTIGPQGTGINLVATHSSLVSIAFQDRKLPPDVPTLKPGFNLLFLPSTSFSFLIPSVREIVDRVMSYSSPNRPEGSILPDDPPTAPRHYPLLIINPDFLTTILMTDKHYSYSVVVKAIIPHAETNPSIIPLTALVKCSLDEECSPQLRELRALIDGFASVIE